MMKFPGVMLENLDNLVVKHELLMMHNKGVLVTHFYDVQKV